MSESESKATTKSSKATKAEGETVAKKKTARKVEPTAACTLPSPQLSGSRWRR
jgi:hypothetical protein